MGKIDVHDAQRLESRCSDQEMYSGEYDGTKAIIRRRGTGREREIGEAAIQKRCR